MKKLKFLAKPFLILLTLLVIVGLAVSYYLFIARPKIKADCINAATRVEHHSDFEGGDRTNFSQERYKECIK